MLRLVEISPPINETPMQLITIESVTPEDAKIISDSSDCIADMRGHMYIKNNFDVAFQFFDNYFSAFNNCTEEIYDPWYGKSILYRIKMMLFSGLEFVDTMRVFLSSCFSNEIERNQNNKRSREAEGTWIIKDISSEIYDSNFSYRLCYNLRNYLQHVSSQGISIEKNQDGRFVQLKVTEYANAHKGIQPSFLRELERGCNDTVDLIDLCYQYKGNIDEMFTKIQKHISIKMRFEEFENSLKSVLILNKHKCDIIKNMLL